ncbi:NAD(P)H azoreductase [Corynebacterium kalinowskii]|uniref:NAD(P)H azoreductase n=1 Tax=Corynebacterium kalinowskii TaxID=2675216 RepID=A0A6B8VN59_9CORY|nr:NAD(P)H-binding protein [Corynebacterium kalinowskii]QGU00967.1 NAD(P)H azoreductase [Corynebacterium kalinowskii]
MRIAVTTPRGHVGHHITAMLIRAGVRPLLLDHNPEKIPAPVRLYADIIEADSTDISQVATATRGVDTIYWVNPSTMAANPLAYYTQATRALINAITENDIKRVVFQSSVGAEKRHGVGEIDGLAATEIALNSLNVDVTHLRCGYFFTNLLLDIDSIRRGHLRTILPPEMPMSWVAPRDIAEVATGVLLNPQWHGHRVQAIHGPRDLCWNQVAQILTDHTGHPVIVEQISDTDMRRQYIAAGMPSQIADAVLGMSTGLRDNFRPEQPRNLTTTTPTTLESWVHDELTPTL